MSEVVAQGWDLRVEQVVGQGGHGTRNRVREEICFAAFHFFHFLAIQIPPFLQLSPSAITRILRRAQNRLMAEGSQLERIKGLLRAG